MFERRLKIFLGLVLLMTAVIIVRLIEVQLLKGQQYRERATSLLTWSELLPTVRGEIIDRRGKILATDCACYDFCLDYRMLKGPGQTKADQKAYRRWSYRQIRKISRSEGVPISTAKEIFKKRLERTWELAASLTGATRNEMFHAAENVVRRIEAWKRYVGMPVREETQPQPIITGLDEETAVRLRTHLDEMVGATVLPSHRRWYPYGKVACHIIGYLGEVTPAEIKNRDGSRSLESDLTDYLPGDLIGRGGVEKLCEKMLRGRRGYRCLRRTGEVIEEIPPIAGKNVHLTIDIELQREISELLDRPGVIIVLDVPTNEVLAMVSSPEFDLNKFQHLYVDLITDHARLPLLNRAVAARYPPGSTVKPIIALAGLSEGVITAETKFYCKGYLHNPNAFRCWIWKYHTGHGWVDVVGSLEHSCNVFFYNVGERLGISREVKWFTKFGFADKPGTELPEERPGVLPNLRRRYSVGQSRHLAIGQGKIVITPMHVVNAIAAIARGGVLMSPVLVRELANRQKHINLGISPDAIRLVKEGMYKVINSPDGTAYKYAHMDDIEICGKTGTAQTPPRRMRIDSDGDGKPDQWGPILCSGDTAWLVGFAPYRKPKIAFVIMIEYSDTGGGPCCGPIARKLMRICKDFGYLQ